MKPGYKRTEVGVIPEEWRVVAIEDISTVGRGRVISHREISRSLSPMYPVYSSQTFDDGVMGYLDSYDFEGEYVTWTTDGANAGTVFYRNGRFNCTNVCGTIKLKSDNHIFVAKILSRFASRHVSRHLGNPKLMNDVMKRVRIPLPSILSEQRAIATALSDADALIASLDRLIAKKRDLKQAAMQELLTGHTRLPGFTGEWEVRRLEEQAVIVSGGTPKTTNRLFWNGGINWCTPTDITGCRGKYLMETKRTITTLGLANSSARMLPVGALLLCTRATIGEIRIAGTDVCTNQGFKSLVCNQDVFNEFLYYKLLTMKPQMVERAIGSTFLEISKRDTASLEIATPNYVEQTAIAAVLSDMDAELAVLEARRDKTRNLKQAMMQELLTGKTRLV